jgi:hypothetical protein
MWTLRYVKLWLVSARARHSFATAIRAPYRLQTPAVDSMHHQVSFSFHFAVCLTTGQKPLPKRAPHIVRSRAPSFKWEYPLLSLMSPSSLLRLLPRLLVTYIPPFIFPSITRCRRQFLRKMWPIHQVQHEEIPHSVHRLSMFCTYLRKYSDYFPIQHKLTGFHSKDWVFTARYVLNLKTQFRLFLNFEGLL